MSDARWADECNRLSALVESAVEGYQELANQLDKWAIESKTGGWSTHQVEPMRERADYLRREAANLKSAITRRVAGLGA